MLRHFAYTFMSKNVGDDPADTIEKAVRFATKIECIPFNGHAQPIAPIVVNMSTTAAKWGFTCTVFYKAVNRIEVDG